MTIKYKVSEVFKDKKSVAPLVKVKFTRLLKLYLKRV